MSDKKLQFELNEEMINLIPAANPGDRAALKNDIKKRWEIFGEDKILLQSILLDPQGRVVDGRTRLEILMELELLVPEDKIERLPYGTTDEQIMMAVKSANMRRNLTTTQKVCIAMRAYLKAVDSKVKTSIDKIAKEYGVGATTLKNAMYIHNKNEDIANKLWAGKHIDVENQKGEPVATASINTVCQYIKRIEEITIQENKDHEWQSSSNIKTQKGKDWYHEQVKINKITDIPVRMMIAELANYKFQEIKY